MYSEDNECQKFASSAIYLYCGQYYGFQDFIFLHFKGRTLNTCSTLENFLKMIDDKTKEKKVHNKSI